LGTDPTILKNLAQNYTLEANHSFGEDIDQIIKDKGAIILKNKVTGRYMVFTPDGQPLNYINTNQGSKNYGES
jgi:hypothetical protein